MEKVEQMEQKEVRKTVQAFCSAWFERRDVAAAQMFLSEDVSFVGTGEQEHARGKAEMTAYIREDIQELSEPFVCTLNIMDEQPLSERFYNLSISMSLKNSLYFWRLRAFFTLEREQESWRIRSFHFAEPSSFQRAGEHYPKTLVLETIARQRQELLNDSLAGGMMGGYIKKDFPFYFINRQMLEYLGYEEEEEFVENINGMISNCFHPDDRSRVESEVFRQLEETGEYMIEYRIKKKRRVLYLDSRYWKTDRSRKWGGRDRLCLY